ncbi:hypothetical protein [Methylocapsa palsarum]|uniref:DUF2946 domain-containing protein n=1 Tax=Methylocapsa palsarum TaxID=1612308 RepID=A0A1I3Y0G8_9HYPH|nr:hypothetical protein [Methylocapsa palsarum]SFK24736.1 hypothetical protein SAMN05444581_104180 [Methylocapsa palsarum]
MFVLAIYLVAGLLHGVCDLDVTNISGKTVISLADKHADHSDQGSLADHHCHGCFCFSISFQAPLAVPVSVAHAVKAIPVLEARRPGLPPGIDLPPPKSLT